MTPPIWRRTCLCLKSKKGVDVVQEVEAKVYVATPSKPYLSRRKVRTATWWEDKTYSTYMRDSITMTYVSTSGAYRSWTEAPQEAREVMYMHFVRRVRIDLGYDLRSDYESRIKKKITDIFQRAVPRVEKAEWIPQEKWEELKRNAADPNFKKKSAVKSSNRRGGQIDGVAKPTSCLGSRSAATAFAQMGPTASPVQLLEKTKKGKDGKWIDPRGPQIVENYEKAVEEARASDQAPNTLKIVHDVTEGYNQKRRFWGIGNAAKDLFRPCLNRGKEPFADTYLPTAASQERTVNTHMEDKFQRQEERLQTLEKRCEEQDRFIEMMRERWAMENENCSWGPHTSRRDDNNDDGHLFGSERIEPLA